MLRKYNYTYDNLNRLLDAKYQKEASVLDSYGEHLKYDKNGNITWLQRFGEYDDTNYKLEIDSLAYSYDPVNKNQLMKVYDNSNNPNGFKDDSVGTSDPVDDYIYDSNGNLIKDDNKGITSIVYNHLNLPTKITFATSGTIEYLYDAVGQKLQKTVTQGTVITRTVYLSGFQYKNNKLEFFPHAEGYVSNTVVNGNNVYNYVFNYTDHLGNVRLSYTYDSASSSLKILEENNYYPFGLKHNNYNMDKAYYEANVLGQIGVKKSAPIPYKYKYNGKELQDELGLNMYDYGARNYDPALGRWVNIDPLADKYENWSSYNYCLNNPVVHVDPDGRSVDNEYNHNVTTGNY